MSPPLGEPLHTDEMDEGPLPATGFLLGDHIDGSRDTVDDAPITHRIIPASVAPEPSRTALRDASPSRRSGTPGTGLRVARYGRAPQAMIPPET